MVTQTVNLAKCTGLGALGFGIGGAITFLLGGAMVLGFFLQGVLGGGLLGLATRSHHEALSLAALAAGASFAGQVVGFFIVMTIWEPSFSSLFVGIVAGAVLGAALGFRSAGLVGAVFTAVVGALGFGVGMVLGLGRWGSEPSVWASWVSGGFGSSWKLAVFQGGLQGTIAGGLLGLSWGYCERRALRGAHEREPASPTEPSEVLNHQREGGEISRMI